MLLVMQKINFLTHFFYTILQRNSKLVILCIVGMLGFEHPKWCYQLVANSCVYLQAKKQLHRPCFSGDIAKTYKLKTKTKDKIFKKIQRISFWYHEKWALSLFRYYKFLLLCKISQKSNDSFLRRIPNWWMDRQTDGRSDRQTDRQRWIYRTLRRTGFFQ